MKSKNRFIIYILCLAILFLPIASFSYALEKSNHSCESHDCPICEKIDFFMDSLLIIKTLIIVVISLNVMSIIHNDYLIKTNTFYPSGNTLISLKVKFTT